MESISNNYYALILIPNVILIISFLILYKLGIRILASIGGSLIFALISIILTDIILLIIILCYLILRRPKNNFCKCCECCKEEDAESLYKYPDVNPNSI